MASVINYRFKSYRDYSTIAFEGTSIPLWELKYEIVTHLKMNSKDFDLLFFDAETEDELTDEYTQISRNSHILVHRIPAWMSKNVFQLREKKPDSTAASRKYYREPPENYVCFRCGNKGHFIQHCPTNNDRTFDIVKIRKPSGIPRDFLERVEGSLEGSSAMLVTESGFVKAKPQTQEWAKHGIASRGRGQIPPELKCPECNFILNNPVCTNCMHHFCEDCVRIDDKCVVCGEIISKISFDEEKNQAVKQYSLSV